MSGKKEITPPMDLRQIQLPLELSSAKLEQGTIYKNRLFLERNLK
jgi:hypothetical protein